MKLARKWFASVVFHQLQHRHFTSSPRRHRLLAAIPLMWTRCVLVVDLFSRCVFFSGRSDRFIHRQSMHVKAKLISSATKNKISCVCVYRLSFGIQPKQRSDASPSPPPASFPFTQPLHGRFFFTYFSADASPSRALAQTSARQMLTVRSVLPNHKLSPGAGTAQSGRAGERAAARSQKE